MKAKKVFLFFLCIVLLMILVLSLWTRQTEAQAHFTPGYQQVDLKHILEKKILEEPDYSLLFMQTGISRTGIQKLWEQGRQQELLLLQERLFAPVEVICEANTIISREERLASGEEQLSLHQAFPLLEKGDILLSFNSHAFGWRCGHAALVVDAEQGGTLEARVLGTDSAILSMGHWVNYPSVAVLRVKGLTEEQRQAVADYAVENLRGIPYNLLAEKIPVEEKKCEEWSVLDAESINAELSAGVFTGTHCAHLVWFAYAAFGYDLDGDGGSIVTPRDLFISDAVEVVQVYGMEVDLSNS